jgi:hypothetical protein
MKNAFETCRTYAELLNRHAFALHVAHAFSPRSPRPGSPTTTKVVDLVSIRESLCRCPGKKERLQLGHRVHQNERILPLFEGEHILVGGKTPRVVHDRV